MSTNVVLERPGEEIQPVLQVANNAQSGVRIALDRDDAGISSPPRIPNIQVPTLSVQQHQQQIQQRQPPRRSPPPRQAPVVRPIRRARPRPPPSLDDDEDDGASELAPDEDTLDAFVNPNKRKADDDMANEYDDEDEEVDDDHDPDNEYDNNNGGEEYYSQQYQHSSPQPQAQAQTNAPSAGYATMTDEKNDLLFKLSRLRTRGIEGIKTFGPNATLQEIRHEFHRIKTELSVESSIKFQREMLMFFATSMEYLNKRYDPLSLELDGWSESVHDNLNNYDNIFESLYFKYKDKISAPPEMQLLLMVGSSAFMFHLSSTFFKQKLPAMQANPDMMSNLFSSLASMKTPPMQQQGQGQGQGQALQGAAALRQRPEMSGPGMGMDFASMLPSLGGLQMPSMPRQHPLPVASRRTDIEPKQPPQQRRRTGSSRSSSSSGGDSSSISGDSDRVSDIVTESLASLQSNELASITTADTDIKDLVISEARGRRRMPQTKPTQTKTAQKKQNKKVVVI